jgi:glycosyltransferase involved in cell wall biosynthesis
MKILFVNEYTLRPGGVDKIVDMEIFALQEKNYAVELFPVYHNKLITVNGNINYSGILKTYLLTLGKLQNAIDRFKPDIVHFHNIYPLLGSPIWKNLRKGNSKFILHLHNYYPFCINSFFFRQNKICTLCQEGNSLKYGIINKCYNHSLPYSIAASFLKVKPEQWINLAKKIDHFISVSNFICQKYVEFGIEKENISTVYNFAKPIGTAEQIKGDYILYLGDVVDAKGIEIICETALRLPLINFVIAGDGRDYHKYISSYWNAGNITFTGYVDKEEKSKLISNCRFVLLPYLSWESFGIVILEAYNYGKPVLTSGMGGSSELVVDGKTGIILENLNYDFVYQKINEFWKLLESNNSYFYNCLHLSRKFNIENHSQKLLDIYRKYSVE